MSNIKNLNTLIIDEIFFREFFICPYRASTSWNRNLKIRVGDSFNKCLRYVPYGETLVYLIMKKIIYFFFGRLKERNSVNYAEFKGFALIILEKEIKSNKEKSIKKDNIYYSAIRKEVVDRLEVLFDIINEFDIEDSIETFIKIKFDIIKYLKKVEERVSKVYFKNIPRVSDEFGNPFFEFDIISINKKSEFDIEVVMTEIADIPEEMKHRNYLIAMISQYIFHYYKKDEEFLNKFNTENQHVSVVTYNPITLERRKYEFADFNGKYSEAEINRILNVIKSGSAAKCVKKDICKFCEQQRSCINKISNNNSYAKFKQELIKKNRKIKLLI